MDRRRLFLVYGTAAGVLALDQVTKSLVIANLKGNPPVRIFGDAVRLVYATNPGGAFSLFTGFPLFFAVMAVVVMGGIIHFSRRTSSAAVMGVLGLLLGGALGNFTDRLLRGDTLLHGQVVDFVDVGPWPVFNVADSAVTIGAIALTLLLSRAPESTPGPAGGAGADGASGAAGGTGDGRATSGDAGPSRMTPSEATAAGGTPRPAPRRP
jgi:signal peptidase II